MTSWHSLYLPYAGNVADSLAEALAALGYERYAPFGLIPGKAYPQSVKLFVAPARGGWTRIIGSPDPALLPSLSRLAPCLLIELDGADADISAYADGAPAAVISAFAPYAQTDCLDRALDAAATARRERTRSAASPSTRCPPTCRRWRSRSICGRRASCSSA